MGRKKKKEQYFDDVQEKAFLEYINSDDEIYRNKVYNTYLRIPFQKMVESILRKYPINTGGVELYELEINALGHLVDQMRLFDNNRYDIDGKKTKAFSYCQTIVRNYFILHSKLSCKHKTRNLFFDDYVETIDASPAQQYEIDSDINNSDNIFNGIINEIEKYISDENCLKNDYYVGDALISILKNWENLFAEELPEGNYQKKITNKFKKSKIFLYIREITNLNDKEIRASLKNFKEIYYVEKQRIINSE